MTALPRTGSPGTAPGRHHDHPSLHELDAGTLRRVYGRFPSGVVAVAAEIDGIPAGLAASSFTSVSLQPALVSLSVANSSATWPVLRHSTHLGLSVLADHQGLVCRQLAGPAGTRFAGLATTVTEHGALFLDDAVVRFDCSVHREVEAGDHTLVLLALHAVQEGPEQSPLVFHGSAFHRLGATA